MAERVRTTLEHVTPQKAQKYLDSRGDNRPISERYAGRLAEAIKSGEFEVNGETLKFDVDNHMIDGQHRCVGCVMAGTPFRSFVTRGLNSCTFDTIDTGKARTVGDVFAKHGETHYRLLSSAVAWLWKFLNGHLEPNHRASPRHPEAIATLGAHPGIRDSIAFGSMMRGLAPSGAMAFLHYVFAGKDRDAADWFFEHLASGEDLAKTSAKSSGIYILHRRLQENRGSKSKLPTPEIIKLTIKGWNAYREGKVVKCLKHSSVGDTRERYPEIHG